MFSFFKPKPDYEKNIDKYFKENENIINLNNSLFFLEIMFYLIKIKQFKII